MIPRSLQDAERLLAEFVGDIDPADPRGRRRRQILEAATELFATHGYRKTSISDIAERAGVAKATFYLHFAAKSDVLVAAIALEKLRTLSSFAESFDQTVPARERLRRWIVSALVVVARSPLLARIVGGDEELGALLGDISSKVVAEANARQFGLFGELIAEVCAPERPTEDEIRERVTAVSALFYLAPLLRADHVRHGMSLERLAERIGDLVAFGVSPRKEAP